jgi:DNA mismatch repair protein MutS
VPDAVLFFRLGDFYEMFFDDAINVSKELELTLTGRDCGLDERAPMCGVPYHAAENYIAKLVEKGYKVAICEQVTKPGDTKGIVKRDVTRIISPGTLSEGRLLEEKNNNYLMSLYYAKNVLGIAYCDVSTGDFYVTEITGKDIFAQLINELAKVQPSELLINPALFNENQLIREIEQRFTAFINVCQKSWYKETVAISGLKKQFNVYSLTAIDLEKKIHGIRSAGALLNYLEETQKQALKHFNNIISYNTNAYMKIDMATRKNLELTATMRSNEKKGSLRWLLDETETAMGGRLLARWLESPLIDKEQILSRQKGVESLVNVPSELEGLKHNLTKIYDLERLCTKIALGSVNPRDLLALKCSVNQIPDIVNWVERNGNDALKAKYRNIDFLEDISVLIEAGISEDAPLTLKDGNYIKTGYHKDVDEYRDIAVNGKNHIAAIESRERERTGIKNLKIKYNKVFNYYIEVSKSNFGKVPEDYIRKQTLANSERYFIPELKELETKILKAKDSLIALEYEVFQNIRQTIISEIKRIQNIASLMAQLDVFFSFAKVSLKYGYTKPVIVETGEITISGGRHPVVEALLGQEHFIPNDTSMNRENKRMMLITGPNMAGKSTYIRQVALITLMTQVGCYVPASSAVISIVDRIFTRVGASDDLTTGQSTFMVEMSEVANILKNATNQSLVILDEIGRGTSTFDGLSIAWAVIEHLLDDTKAKTLFATHYHELTELESLKKGIHNYCIQVKETETGVLFMRTILKGSADQSYGIEVAKLAGFPEKVTNRANVILEQLEENEETYRQRIANISAINEKQISLFEQFHHKQENSVISGVIDEIKTMELNGMTPLDSLNYLHRIRELLNEIEG